MTIESLSSEIAFVIDDCNGDTNVGNAALNDFTRSLHEIFTKSGRDQIQLISEVQAVFGSTPANHLARVLHADNSGNRASQTYEDCLLATRVKEICLSRGIRIANGKHFFAHFLKALDEERFDSDGNRESAVFITYWSVGHEAAYHLGGLFTGDHADAVTTEIQYLDYRLRRFRTYVERWELELQWDKEDN